MEDESEFMGCCWHQSYILCNARVILNSWAFHAFYKEGVTYLREENSSKHINF